MTAKEPSANQIPAEFCDQGTTVHSVTTHVVSSRKEKLTRVGCCNTVQAEKGEHTEGKTHGKRPMEGKLLIDLIITQLNWSSSDKPSAEVQQLPLSYKPLLNSIYKH